MDPLFNEDHIVFSIFFFPQIKKNKIKNIMALNLHRDSVIKDIYGALINLEQNTMQ